MSARIAAILFDFGDTLADEDSERDDDIGGRISSELLPGARELLHGLAAEGRRLAIVADSVKGTGGDSYRAVLREQGVEDCFDCVVVSGDVGVEKPDPRLLEEALRRLGVAREDYGDVLMVGNRLDRDVEGANALGLTSVWIRRDDKYGDEPQSPLQRPDYTIERPLELRDVIAAVEGGRDDS